MLTTTLQAAEPTTGEPAPEAREAVGQLSAVVLVTLLLVILATCVLLLVALRRGKRVDERAGKESSGPDAWSESGRRVDLEDSPDIPREPGTR